MLIKNIFKDFEVPVEFIRYTGKEKTYITYSFIDDRPGVVADDKEILSIANIDIDIFSDSNYLDIEEKVEKIMIENNFIRVGSSPDMYEEDTGLYHKTIEFEKERIR
jgi:hypothetical protein